MPKPYPNEFREDVVRVVTNRDKNTSIGQIAKDFGIHEGTIAKWVRQAELDDGNPTNRTLGPTTDEKNELRELRRRNRVLEQELEVMRRAAAYFGQSHLPSK